MQMIGGQALSTGDCGGSLGVRALNEELLAGHFPVVRERHPQGGNGCFDGSKVAGELLLGPYHGQRVLSDLCRCTSALDQAVGHRSSP
jgi:hypothetical protein